MSFEVQADAYGRFMGRYSEPLAAQFVSFAGVAPGQRALDVGCGTGVLTAELVPLLGGQGVAAVEPSTAFVSASRARFPDLDIRQAFAEQLPFPDGTFDVALAQLVVHFMTDPVAGLREMARVTRPGGTVAASVWDHAGGRGPLTTFWRAVHDVDPQAHNESGSAGSREGHLAELFAGAGLSGIRSTALTVTVRFASFDEWWEPYTLGVGPAGDYVKGLDPARRGKLRDRCAALLGVGRGPFEVTASAWSTSGAAA